MYWSRKKKQQQEVQEVATAVWECEAESCAGWMRKNYSLENHPACPLCGTKMTSGERMLVDLSN
ncbi:cold-inducible protein YdjO-related protein [Ectobacillus ponti]|uniref:Cold-shock protein n=1 Tax=Ectobacillus ponti TaxID=2961894 RepID=A0AA41XAD6_9BACI|nr:cold-inducible protein YdjO-related protein [Ectobacillus ponti]MCP8969203.1 cold-shock protein [Ectobacillus ponti]